jgi:tetratricopeptide (TPR) repeat protein
MRHSSKWANSSATVMAVVLGLAATVAVFSAAPAWSADAPAKQTVSKAVAKPLKAAQDLLTAKKWSEAIAKLQEVQNIQGRSAYDNHLINEMLGFAYVKSGNYPEAAKALEAGLADGELPAADVSQRVKTLAQLNYQNKNYPKAIEFGNRAIKNSSTDSEMYTLVGQAYYLSGDNKGALKFMNSYVEQLEKSGEAPKEQSLLIILSSCGKLEDDACTTRALERLVARYPKTEYWQNLLYSLVRAQGNDDKQMLDIYRLMLDVDVLKRPDDYTEMAQLAIEAGSPGEAQRALEKGFAKNVFGDTREKDKNTRLLESAKKQAASDQAQLAQLDKSTGASKSGDPDVKLGLAYLSYDQYDKAVAAIQRGIAKGSVKNPDEAQLLLGIALLKAKNREEAIKAFKVVKSDAKLGRVAALWALHAQQG